MDNPLLATTKKAIVSYKDKPDEYFDYLSCKGHNGELHFVCPDLTEKTISLTDTRINNIKLV